MSSHGYCSDITENQEKFDVQMQQLDPDRLLMEKIAEEIDRLQTEAVRLQGEREECDSFLGQLDDLDFSLREQIDASYEKKLSNRQETMQAMRWRLRELGAVV